MSDRETPRYGHAPIPMLRVVDGWMLTEIGHFHWQVGGTGNRTLVLMIPATFEEKCCYSRWTIEHPNADGHAWKWDGDEESPTLTPSIHAVGMWHGHVTAGMLVEA